MRRSTIVRIALGVGLSSFLLPGSVAPCYGDTIVAFASIFSLQAGAGTTLATQDHLFAAQQFDPTLGTLDDIVVSFVRGGINATIDTDNESPFSVAVFQDEILATAFDEVSYAGGSLANSNTTGEIGPSPGVTVLFDIDGVPDFLDADALSSTGPIPVDAFDTTITDPAILGDFTGLGGVLVTFTLTELGAANFPGLHDIKASYAGTVGAISMTYEFTPAAEPAPVPETGTGMLLLLGLTAWRARGYGTRTRRKES